MSSPAESSVRLKDDRGRKRKASSPAEKPSEECDLKQQHCEQGVRYIEELAGLLSSNNLELWDFNLRPNKAAALRKVLGQIRIQEYQTEEKSSSPVEKTWEREDLLMVRGCSEVLVRQLLDALGGFFFAVNEEGVMVFVSKNVRRYLRYEQKELLGSSVYSLLHVGDHAKFVRILLPKSLANSMSRPSSVQQQKHQDSSPGERSFTCRMLLNPPHEDDNRDVHKPEKPQAYIMMQCFAVPRPDALPEKVEDPHKCLMCVVRPIDVARAAQQSFGSKQDLKAVLRGGAQSPVCTIRVADKSMVASQPHSRLLRHPNAQQPHDITSADHLMARDHANRHDTPLGQSRNGEPAHMWSQIHSPGLHCQPAPAHGCVSLSEARDSSGQGQCECDEQLQSSTNVGSSNSTLDVPPRDTFVTSPPPSHSLSPFTSRPALIEATNQPPASSPLNQTPHTVSCFNSCSTSHLFTPGSWSIQHRPLENTLSSSEPILQLISSHTIPTPIASPGHCASAVSHATHDLQTTCPPLIEPSPDTDQLHLLSETLSTNATSRDNTDVEVFVPCQTNNVATEELTSDDTRCLESWTQVTGNEIKNPGVVEKVVVSEAGVRGSDGQHADDRKRIQLLKHFAKGSAVEANTVKPERGAQEVIMAQVCAHTGPSFSIKYNEQNEDGIPQTFEELRMHQSWPNAQTPQPLPAAVNNVEKFEHRVASTDGVWDFQSSGTSTSNDLKLEPPAANADNILYLQRSVACNTVDVKKRHDASHDIGMYSFTVAPQHPTNAMAGPPESVGPQPDVQVGNNLDFWIYDSGYVSSPCNAQAHMDEPTYTSSRHDEKFLLDQLNTLLNSTNDLDLAEIDKALGIDMLMQTGVPHTAAGALPSAVYGHPYNRGTVSVPYSGAFVSQPSHLSNAASVAQHGLYMTQGIHLGGIPSHSAAPQLLGASQGQISPNQLQLQLQQRLQSPQQAPMNVQAMMQQRREMLRRKQHPQHNMLMKQTLACGVAPNSTVPSGFLLSSSDSSTQLYMHPITNTVTAGAPHPITQFSPISPNLIIQQGNSGMIQQQTARVEMGPATCSYEHVRGNSLEQNNLQFPTADMTHQSDPAYGGQGPLTSLGMSHLRRSALTDFRPISPDLGWQPIPGVTNTPNAQNRGCVSRPQHMVTPGMYVHPTAVSRPSECIEPPGMQVVRMGTEQQVEVYADVQCTVNLLENDSYLCQPPGGLACVTQPVVSMPGHVQGSSLLQQLLTE